MSQNNLYGVFLVLVITTTSAVVTRLGRRPSILRYILSLLIFLPHYYIYSLFVHDCDEGQPSFIVTGVCAYFLTLSINKRSILLLGNFLLLASTCLFSYWYITIVHSSENLTGNPIFRDGDFWHSKLTNIYPATPASRKAGYELKVAEQNKKEE